ncbi:Parvovirus coat protein VP1-like protein [Solibacillus sp. MA9]|uniref:Parvovirus coat protein VP1-like protein n=1 Tax=Solibacillus palustris TaxID=2908203 RepID=A0ABS9UE17_9BACL|nr:Parvovirus coat protein VP1-like protein [Solibacillus sp. MA9]MCH7322410.1 Parvovirus coat protein VP1-like protein [Solibacillus sp. MA9]
MKRQRKLGFCYPGYRYCGPGCTGPGKPTNPVDACCKLHDECYSRNGRTQYCDEMFYSCLSPKINNYSKTGRDAAMFTNIIKLRNKFF